MNPFVGPALCITVLVCAAGTAAQCATLGSWLDAASALRVTLQPVSPDATPTAASPPGVPPNAPVPPAVPTVPPAEPGPSSEPQIPGVPASPGPAESPGTGPGALPVPIPTASAAGGQPAGRFHLHRPGTDVDGDLLTGSLASHVFVLKGDVVLHSDPKIDREIAEASESDEPLSVTADEIDVDQVAFTYVAKGHVHFVQGNRSGFADLATLNEEAHTLDLVGNAVVLDGEHRTTAAKMHYNTADKQFVGGGDVRIYSPIPISSPGAATPPPKHKRRLPF